MFRRWLSYAIDLVRQWLILRLVCGSKWDEAKNRANQQKHGISFNEARDLFTSGFAYLEIFDAAHSIDEDRFICIGLIRDGVAVVVITTLTASGDAFAGSRDHAPLGGRG